jgi:hypothetical protein
MRDIDNALGQLARQPGCEPREVAAARQAPGHNRTRRPRFDAFIRRLCEQGTAERGSLSPIADFAALIVSVAQSPPSAETGPAWRPKYPGRC